MDILRKVTQTTNKFFGDNKKGEFYLAGVYL